MTVIPELTMVCIDCKNYGAAVTAIKKSLQQIKPARTLFLTDIAIDVEGAETIIIPAIKSKQEYSAFCIKELYKYFDTSHVLVIQADGYVINGSAWSSDFLVDYIGASWNFDWERQVGNGGCSIRSHKLQKILGEDSFIDVLHPEDQSIAILYKFYLEQKYGIEFAAVEVADRFAYELKTPIHDTFAFHGNFHPPYQKTVIISRKAAMGDVIQVEPVLHYFFKKGYRVVLDTLPQFFMLFIRHYFKIHTIEELDQRLIPGAEVYNLDMSYESKPEQLHLKTYFEFCNVPKEEMEIRNPKLSIGFDVEKLTRLFRDKYCILHVDNRAQPGRNIYGVDWEMVAEYLRVEGYIPVQVGRDDSARIPGVLQLTTQNEHFLAYVCAGASLFVGIDSGVSHICSGFDIPSVIFFGSVSPVYIHPDLSNITVITNHSATKPLCNNVYCWHSVVGCEGIPCEVDQQKPPCTQFSTQQAITGISQRIKKSNGFELKSVTHSTGNRKG